MHQWKKCISVATVVVMLSTVLIGSVSASAVTQGQEAESKSYRIVALGDSITVGYEPKMDLNSKPYGFVERLYEQGLFHGRTTLSNYGILGLKGAGLEHFVEAAKQGQPITADAIQAELVDPRAGEIGASAVQLKSDIASADLITITIGGNDLRPIVESALAPGSADFTSSMENLFTSYITSMTSVIGNLHELNSDALIVVADQYQPIPAIANQAMYPKLLAASDKFTGVVDKMAANYQSQGVNVKIAHVAKDFVGGEGTMTHIIADRDIHPNQLGYEAIAKVFAETVWGEYRKPSIIDKTLPMTIVVKGKELNTAYKPVLRNNQNFVAIQDIVTAVGATSKWDSLTSSATITYGTRTVIIKIGSTSVMVNGQSVPTDTPAFLYKIGKEDKTYVPLALLASGLGLEVEFSSKLRTAFINL
ncbi:stalk domain-containing protein [Paenibacillus macquariensis]|uniref:Lysophospholipase L1 n=1 Tax=Paenibacillus macquariensis TaxID=948756 RepID=A0ABY1KBU6_9BACL|nr:stalk domain-containing protein [Paenibacillus macquariensis]MEC0093552.1 stalk domain-containing protein [Paenibacillus macquariensis]OAB29840.1 copper amine oxidase [Paenibacillus macquariensis subsp. macquariensis]SIR56586.1 Lysophospholipase L1 [Paenibacillus macquariensis]